MALLIVKAQYDSDAAVWYVAESDVPGLATEAATLEGLRDKVRIMAAELLAENHWTTSHPTHQNEVAIEIIAHLTDVIRVAA